MKIKVFGAAGGEVTGSAYLVHTEQADVLIDCGMFQGGKASEARNKLPQGTRVRDIDAVLLTHGHLDHTGRVPLLVKFGFNGPIYSSKETLALSQIILEDSARLQTADAARQNRKNLKRGMPPFEPLYTTDHVAMMRELVQPVVFNSPVKVAEGITATWIEAGHMLGSGSIQLVVKEKGKTKTVVFSGDLGPLTLPLLRPFEHFDKADLVFMESTYGDRDHKSYEETISEFQSIVKNGVASGAKMLVPSFAIGRAQQIIYHLAEMFHNKLVSPFPVYLDSPMALKAFAVYQDHQNLLDEEYQELKRRGAFPLDTRYFIPSESAESSKSLNAKSGPCMILAGAGMCNGGRILHHLSHNIDKQNTHVLIVGFQSHGSIGRKLVERAEKISIFGNEKVVRAKVHTLSGFSAHAGQTELLKWYSHLAPTHPKTCIVHGEDGPRKALASQIKKQFNIEAVLPKIGETITL